MEQRQSVNYDAASSSAEIADALDDGFEARVTELVDLGVSADEARRIAVDELTPRRRSRKLRAGEMSPREQGVPYDAETGRALMDPEWREDTYDGELEGKNPDEIIAILTDRKAAQEEAFTRTEELLQREVKIEPKGHGSSGRSRTKPKPKPTSAVERARYDELDRSLSSRSDFVGARVSTTVKTTLRGGALGISAGEIVESVVETSLRLGLTPAMIRGALEGLGHPPIDGMMKIA
jgi:hypothetical protein